MSWKQSHCNAIFNLMLILGNSIWNTVNYETTVSSSLVLKTYSLSRMYHRILNLTYINVFVICIIV